MNIRNTGSYQHIITDLQNCINEISSVGDGSTDDDLRLLNPIFNAAQLREELYEHLGEVFAWLRKEPPNDPGRAERVSGFSLLTANFFASSIMTCKGRH